ncbi:hypothetical protein BS50DRAFT_462463, partial [Corynespora cassiicola Philippines]
SFDDIDINEPIRPPPSAVTSSTVTAYDPHSDSPSPLDDFSASRRSGHQRSLTDTLFDNCQPFLNRATTTIQQHTSRASLHSPTKSLASFIPSRNPADSTTSQPTFKTGAKAFQNWFNGSSAPVSVGVHSPSVHEDDSSDDEYDSAEEEGGRMMAGIFNRGASSTRSSSETPKQPSPAPSKQQQQQQQPTATSKFAWLLNTQKNAAVPPPEPSPTYHNPSDELLSLNLSQALFPHGPVEPLDPSSFHDLLSNAEALLARYQTAYRKLSSALVDARAEQSAQEDELDESDTRNRHLKMQLETMAARATEQDAQMQKLVEDLEFERRARQEEEAARKRTLALIRGTPGCNHLPNEQDLLSPKRRNRVSNSDVSVDSGFESECETDAASVFSRNGLSPTSTEHSSMSEYTRDITPRGKRPQMPQRQVTFDRSRNGSVDLEKGGWGCTNCEGGAQASVWGRLAREREENSTLRLRVEELEDAVDSALNVVDGPWGL